MLVRFTQRTSAVISLSVVFVLYEIVAMLGVYYVELKGSSVDAGKFHNLATAWSEEPELTVNIGVQAYVQLLGALYYLLGSNQFLGAQISIVAIMCSGILITRFLWRQNVKYTGWIVLLCLLWPSLVMRSATTMREPLILLSIVCLVTSLVYFIQMQKRRDLLLAFVSGGALFLLHRATGFISIAIFGVAFVYITFFTKVLFSRKALLLFCLLFTFLVALVFVNQFSELREMRVLSSVAQGDVSNLNKMLEMKYTKAAEVSRASYSAPISFNSPIGFVGSMFTSFIHYMLEPFPQRIQNLLDLIGFIEVVFRVLFVAYICFYWRRLNNGLKFMFFAYVALSFVWASGTTNYGTASRHHAVGFWILLILSAIIFSTNKSVCCKQASKSVKEYA